VKITEEDTFYSIDTNKVLLFEYTQSSESSINFVCPKDKDGNFVLIEISENGIDFTHICNGSSYISLDLSTEDKFFQNSTIMDLGFSYDELCSIRMDFLKYYNGFIDGMTIFI
jgi:hypothetical protein